VSIYGRTLLLMLAAVAVAEGIGLGLPIAHQVPNDAPMRMSTIARRLREPFDNPAPDHPPPPGPVPGSPDPFAGGHGPPPMRGIGPSPFGPPWASNTDLTVNNAEAPPALPAGSTLTESANLRDKLAKLLDADPQAVIFYASKADQRSQSEHVAHDDPLLNQSFIAGVRLPDQRWRVAERIVEGFPDAMQKRAMLVFLFGLAALLPLAWLFARALSAPIRRFAEAAKRVGHDPNAPPLPREGPAEMLAAVDSFNSMQARLNRLIQERTHMVGAIAHDLRTPLTRLAFRLDDLPPPLGEKVSADIQEMKSMISAALDFIRDRSSIGQHERLDFRLLVERVVDDQSDLGHDVTLQAGVPITIQGVPLALRRMVVNLVENALKYGERARLRLNATSRSCTLEIDDDGPGIPEPLQAQVFEPFFRLEASRNRDTGGIGLGLASVRAIVLDHGGDITLGNRKGGGLRVMISLPMAHT
jgi:two-component system OmpR family sensor kinase